MSIAELAELVGYASEQAFARQIALNGDKGTVFETGDHGVLGIEIDRADGSAEHHSTGMTSKPTPFAAAAKPRTRRFAIILTWKTALPPRANRLKRVRMQREKTRARNCRSSATKTALSKHEALWR